MSPFLILLTIRQPLRSAADRTHSRRHRAGSRRNKRLRNVGRRASDYPASWQR